MTNNLSNFPATMTPTDTSTDTSTDASIDALAHLIADAADDRKGRDITMIKVGDVSSLADYFVIVTGASTVQVRAIAGSIEDKVEKVTGRKPRYLEGMNEGIWVLVDYGDVVAHILMPQEREYYNLEAFWAHGEPVPFVPKPD
jgi:ribosome-associated protein